MQLLNQLKFWACSVKYSFRKSLQAEDPEQELYTLRFATSKILDPPLNSDIDNADLQ